MGSWRYCTVAEIAVADGIAGGPFGSELVRSDYVPTGVPVIRGGNLGVGDKRFEARGFVFVSQAKADALRRNLAVPGDVVVTQRGTLGQVGIVPDTLGFDRFVISQSQMRLRCDPTKADPRYVFYWLLHPETVRHIEGNAVAAGVPHINLKFFRTMRLPLPPLEEQRAIADVLGSLDDKIDLNRQMNETLEAMARAVFKSWFVDFDPVRAKAEGRAPAGMDAATAALFPSRLAETAEGEVPDGWRRSTLGVELVRCGGAIQTGPFGSQLHASDYDGVGVPVVMPQDIAARTVSEERIARVSPSHVQRLARHMLAAGDLVYSRRGDVEKHAAIGEREAGWLCGTGCLLVRPGPDSPSPLFWSFAMDRMETREFLVRHAVGATMPNLNTGILASVPVVVPPDGLLRRFQAFASPIERLRAINAAQVLALVRTREALLPRLLSGELRATDAERASEAAQ